MSQGPFAFVAGLAGGLRTTARTMRRTAITQEYPDVLPDLPPRSRGVIALVEENCTSCMLCARECPDWCIYIDSHKETIPATTPGGRDRQRNVLDRFAIDFALCMYCGICIEACPFDALHWSPVFELAETDIRDLLHERDRLAKWAQTIPPPQPLDPAAPDPAELAASRKPARPARPAADGAPAAERPARPERPERPARADRPDRPPRAERPAGAERPERPERPARPPRVEPAERSMPLPRPQTDDHGAEAPRAAAPEAPAAPEAAAAPEAPATAGEDATTQVLPTVASDPVATDGPGAQA